MSEFFLKVKNYDDYSLSSSTLRKRANDFEIRGLFEELLHRGFDRVELIHIERLTNEN